MAMVVDYSYPLRRPSHLYHHHEPIHPADDSNVAVDVVAAAVVAVAVVHDEDDEYEATYSHSPTQVTASSMDTHACSSRNRPCQCRVNGAMKTETYSAAIGADDTYEEAVDDVTADRDRIDKMTAVVGPYALDDADEHEAVDTRPAPGDDCRRQEDNGEAGVGE